jgi:hypothetical protein
MNFDSFVIRQLHFIKKKVTLFLQGESLYF